MSEFKAGDRVRLKPNDAFAEEFQEDAYTVSCVSFEMDQWWLGLVELGESSARWSAHRFEAVHTTASEPGRSDLIPPRALLAVARVFAASCAKHGAAGWLTDGSTVLEHLGKGESHAQRYRAGLDDEDHLAHAAARMLIALDKREAVRAGLLPAVVDDSATLAVKGGAK